MSKEKIESKLGRSKAAAAAARSLSRRRLSAAPAHPQRGGIAGLASPCPRGVHDLASPVDGIWINAPGGRQRPSSFFWRDGKRKRKRERFSSCEL